MSFLQFPAQQHPLCTATIVCLIALLALLPFAPTFAQSDDKHQTSPAVICALPLSDARLNGLSQSKTFTCVTLAARRKDYARAVALLDLMIDREPEVIRLRLERARMLFEDEKYGAADREFKRALRLNPPAGVRRTVERFQAEINRRRRFDFDLDVSVTPTDNLLNATSNDSIQLFGLPFSFDSGGDVSAVTVRLAPSVKVQRPFDGFDGQVYAKLTPSVEWNSYHASEFQTNLAFETGIARQDGPNSVRAFARYDHTYDSDGSDLHQNRATVGARYAYSQGPVALGLSPQVSLTHTQSFLDVETVLATDVAWKALRKPWGDVTLTFAPKVSSIISNDATRVRNRADVSLSARLKTRHVEGQSYIGYGRSAYRSGGIFTAEPRADNDIYTGITVAPTFGLFRRVTPVIGYSYNRRDSNQQIFDYDRHSASLAVRLNLF